MSAFRRTLGGPFLVRPEDTFEETWNRAAARGADRGNFDHHVVSKAVTVCIGRGARSSRMSVRHEDLGVIERRAPIEDPLVGERFQKTRRSRRSHRKSAQGCPAVRSRYRRAPGRETRCRRGCRARRPHAACARRHCGSTHACTPSLPTCMSQKSALPRAIAIALSLTNSARFDGTGTATARKSPGRLSRSVCTGGFRTRGMVVSGGASARRIVAATVKRTEVKNTATSLKTCRMTTPPTEKTMSSPGTTEPSKGRAGCEQLSGRGIMHA